MPKIDIIKHYSSEKPQSITNLPHGCVPLFVRQMSQGFIEVKLQNAKKSVSSRHSYVIPLSIKDYIKSIGYGG